jgi:hypothetical protein
MSHKLLLLLLLLVNTDCMVMGIFSVAFSSRT